jgi:hypothetical protein
MPLGFASIFKLGFRYRWNPAQYFFIFLRLLCFETGPPLRREGGVWPLLVTPPFLYSYLLFTRFLRPTSQRTPKVIVEFTILPICTVATAVASDGAEFLGAIRNPVPTYTTKPQFQLLCAVTLKGKVSTDIPACIRIRRKCCRNTRNAVVPTFPILGACTRIDFWGECCERAGPLHAHMAAWYCRAPYSVAALQSSTHKQGGSVNGFLNSMSIKRWRLPSESFSNHGSSITVLFE